LAVLWLPQARLYRIRLIGTGLRATSLGLGACKRHNPIATNTETAIGGLQTRCCNTIVHVYSGCGDTPLDDAFCQSIACWALHDRICQRATSHVSCEKADTVSLFARRRRSETSCCGAGTSLGVVADEYRIPFGWRRR